MKFFQRIIGIPGLHNLGVVAEGKIYRSAQPELYEALPQYLSVKTVLNLREFHYSQEEVEKAGMKYIPFRINVFSDISNPALDLLVQTLSNPVNHPVLFHCLQGQDRTGVVCAAYRLAVDKWTLSDVLAEMEAYGAFSLWWKMKEAVEAYAEAKEFK